MPRGELAVQCGHRGFRRKMQRRSKDARAHATCSPPGMHSRFAFFPFVLVSIVTLVGCSSPSFDLPPDSDSGGSDTLVAADTVSAVDTAPSDPCAPATDQARFCVS